MYLHYMRNHLAVLVLLCSMLNGLCLKAQNKLPDPYSVRKSGMHPSDCSRATPDNIIDYSVFPGTKFLLTDDSLNGYNWVNFSNGDKLLVVNCGCTDFTLVFQFTTTRYSADTTNYTYWYPKAAELLAEVAKGVYEGAPFSIKKGADTLKSFTQHYPDSLKLNRSIFFYAAPPMDKTSDDDGSSDISAMLPHFFISRITKQSDKEYMVEITFTVSL